MQINTICPTFLFIYLSQFVILLFKLRAAIIFYILCNAVIRYEMYVLGWRTRTLVLLVFIFTFASLFHSYIRTITRCQYLSVTIFSTCILVPVSFSSYNLLIALCVYASAILFIFTYVLLCIRITGDTTVYSFTDLSPVSILASYAYYVGISTLSYSTNTLHQFLLSSLFNYFEPL